ncbi:Serine/threonine-protein phosphatase 6 regulatory ankyrin repeat subunit A [Trichoplax sp. H2]|nr:Serine/threonine-protein phosphatase 6 regulatory ankyrin repeat subunit A [Trichoplax sp. H2]|eukprot:RDD41816.1 Serine/threonine-protein phosphatase 6 regulatory ankyrin repeat subunit A [Trichoplax sp. H2]
MDATTQNIDIQSTNKKLMTDRDGGQSPDVKRVHSNLSGRSSIAEDAEPIKGQDEILYPENYGNDADHAENSQIGSLMFTAEELYAVEDDDLAEMDIQDPLLHKQLRIDAILLNDEENGGSLDSASEPASSETKPDNVQDDDNEDLEFLNTILQLEDTELKMKLHALNRGMPSYSRRNSSQVDGANFRSGSNLSGSRFPSRRSSVISSITGFSSEMSTVVTDTRQVLTVNSTSLVPVHDLENAVELLLASERGDSGEVVALLFKDHINPNVCGNNNRTPLHCAAGYGHKEIVESLLQAKALVDSKTSSGRAALHEACIGGHTQVVEELLRHGACMDIQDDQMHTPMQLAAYNGEADCVKVLLEKGANAYITDNFGRTAAHLAATKNHPDVMEVLITSGINIDKRDTAGRHPAHLTCMHGSYHVLQLLYKYDVNLYCIDRIGAQPAHYAATISKLNCLKYLVEIAGCDLDILDNNKKTLAHMAAQNGSVECLHWLLEKGADPNVTDRLGQTPTHFAALGGHAECFNCLLNHHGDHTDVRNRIGDNAIDTARRGGHPQVITKAVTNKIRCSQCVIKEKKLKAIEDSRPPPVIANILEKRTTMFDMKSLSPEKKSSKQKSCKSSQLHNSRSKHRPLAAKFYGPSLLN